MEVREIPLPAATKLAADYIAGAFPAESGFAYAQADDEAFCRRLAHLQRRTYDRNGLADYLHAYHRSFSASAATMANIEKLRDERSVVIVGGQQAGLLTGPLYTIYKIITIIQLAKEQERKLGVPVVPLFWIAGEDHDIAEIDHVYVVEEGEVKKAIYPHKPNEKRMAADVPLDRRVAKEWVERVVKTYGETDVTNELLSFLSSCLDEARTFVDFFAVIVLRLFAEHGLVVLNAGDAAVRPLERRFFAALIERHRDVTDAVLAQQEELRALGYAPLIEIGRGAANLFYYDGRERSLLQYDEERGLFHNKAGTLVWTREELLELAETKPSCFSNNVVTRPLMQEYLLPTLAFVAGPGEIAYWAELKGAFPLFDLEMPPVVPRLQATLVSRSLQTDLSDIGLEAADVLTGRLEEAKRRWREATAQAPLASAFAKAREDIEAAHRPLRELGVAIDRGLEGLVAKNAAIIQAQIEFLQHAFERALLRKHETEWRKFWRIETSLRPNGAFQERVWNVFYYINRYGFNFVEKLLAIRGSSNGMHKIVYM
ncbi:bacillithiol biosynthesis cysteine-adding enzyme BshC [Geobacillus thermoleovorans]|uniref:bacillithiol biosynthesis cysteine-adding enzyme BshC n=1 Tax=Geobacillus thermoleovorans TaxID=33941 RepID=UPI00345B898E